MGSFQFVDQIAALRIFGRDQGKRGILTGSGYQCRHIPKVESPRLDGSVTAGTVLVQEQLYFATSVLRRR
jgi:hypothetical protein